MSMDQPGDDRVLREVGRGGKGDALADLGLADAVAEELFARSQRGVHERG
jgi:hypothetical protein